VTDYDDHLADYVDVAARLRELRNRYPAASLGPADPAHPFAVVEVAGATYLAYTALCRRWPGDTDPGVGCAWEPVPGRTPYTRDSELQNAETSAWGRAIVAALAADTHAGVASRDEVAARIGGQGPLRIAQEPRKRGVRAQGTRGRPGRTPAPPPASEETAEAIERRLAALPTDQRAAFGEWRERGNYPPLPATRAVRRSMARRLAELEADVAGAEPSPGEDRARD
jgi:hypothetical protein